MKILSAFEVLFLAIKAQWLFDRKDYEKSKESYEKLAAIFAERQITLTPSAELSRAICEFELGNYAEFRSAGLSFRRALIETKNLNFDTRNYLILYHNTMARSRDLPTLDYLDEEGTFNPKLVSPRMKRRFGLSW